MVDAFEVENFFGLKKGTSAPFFFEYSAILFESVETNTLPTPDLRQEIILCSNKGLDPKIFIFLFLILFDPDLAGIIISKSFFIYEFNIFLMKLSIFNEYLLSTSKNLEFELSLPLFSKFEDFVIEPNPLIS